MLFVATQLIFFSYAMATRFGLINPSSGFYTRQIASM